MVTIADVTAMLPLITPYSMPTDTTQANLLFSIAEQKVVSDNIPTTDNILLTKAYCFYIAHLMTNKTKSDGVASEHLGEWSVTYSTNATTSHWIEEYDSIKSDLIRGALISGDNAVQIDDTVTSRYLPIDGVRRI